MRVWPLSVFVLAIACNETPRSTTPTAPAKQATATQAAVKTASVTAPAPVAWAPKSKAGTHCKWTVTESYGEQLGVDANAGYKLTADILARAVSPTHWQVFVERVQVRAKRGEYKATLDSNEPGIMRRVSGGADTTVMFDMIAWFSLVQQPLEFTVATTGRVVKVQGGQNVRDRLHSWFPPAPRKLKRSKDLANNALSDANLAAMLLPANALWPADPPDSAEPWNRKRLEHYADFAADFDEMWRMRAFKKQTLLEEQSILSPSDKPSKVSARTELPERKLLRGTRKSTIAVTPGQACFDRAGMNETRAIDWRGYIDEAEVKMKQAITLTRVYERKDPPL